MVRFLGKLRGRSAVELLDRATLERAAAFYRAERAGVSSQNAALRDVFGELEPPAPEPAAA